MRFGKVAAVATASALTLSLAACGGSDSGSSSNDAGGKGSTGGDDYVLAYGVEPQNPLVPGNTNENGGGRLVDNIYSGLVYYDGEGKAHNELAESIQLEGEDLPRHPEGREVVRRLPGYGRGLRQGVELHGGKRAARLLLLRADQGLRGGQALHGGPPGCR